MSQIRWVDELKGFEYKMGAFPLPDIQRVPENVREKADEDFNAWCRKQWDRVFMDVLRLYKKPSDIVIYDNKTLGYYGWPFGGTQQPDPPNEAPKSKPTNCVGILKEHEEAVEKTLADMPRVRQLIIYRQLYAQGTRIDNIDREIYREAQKELKG